MIIAKCYDIIATQQELNTTKEMPTLTLTKFREEAKEHRFDIEMVECFGEEPPIDQQGVKRIEQVMTASMKVVDKKTGEKSTIRIDEPSTLVDYTGNELLVYGGVERTATVDEVNFLKNGIPVRFIQYNRERNTVYDTSVKGVLVKKYKLYRKDSRYCGFTESNFGGLL